MLLHGVSSCRVILTGCVSPFRAPTSTSFRAKALAGGAERAPLRLRDDRESDLVRRVGPAKAFARNEVEVAGGCVPEKFNAVEGTSNIDAEYGNQVRDAFQACFFKVETGHAGTRKAAYMCNHLYATR
jgi:hypothetical protein